MSAENKPCESLELSKSIHEGGSYVIKNGQPVKSQPKPETALVQTEKEPKK